MMEQYWSWILTIVGLTGFILAGEKVWWCWYINLGCQGLWFAYAITTGQYGFIVASIVYAFVFTQNAIKWTRAHRKPIDYKDCQTCNGRYWNGYRWVPTRETVGLVCQTCGHDYAKDEGRN